MMPMENWLELIQQLHKGLKLFLQKVNLIIMLGFKDPKKTIVKYDLSLAIKNKK